MNLTIEQMRKIVDGAPEWAVAVNMNNGMYYDKSEVSKGDIWLIDLRAALADHDRTDYVSDIRNHISPTTKVINKMKQGDKAIIKKGFRSNANVGKVVELVSYFGIGQDSEGNVFHNLWLVKGDNLLVNGFLSDDPIYFDESVLELV